MTEQLTDIWHDRRVNIGYETAEELARKLNPANFRGHPESQADALDDSLDLLGWVGSVKVNIQTGKIFDGELRIKRTLVKDPSIQIPVDYYDLTPDEELLALQIHDAITEQAEPIADKLADLLERTREMTADRPGLGAMLDRLRERAGINGHQPKEDAGPQVNKAADLQKKWQVKLGDVFELGQHRLVCGDCTDRATVEAVMNGERATLMVTDPPYGIEHRNDAIPTNNHKEHLGIANDERDAAGFVNKFIESVKWFDGTFYIFGAYVQMPIWYTLLSEWRKVNQVLVWVKDNAVLSRLHFNLKFELIYNGYDSRSIWNGDNTQDDVFMNRNVNSFGYIKDDGSRNAANDAQAHPHQKPLDLICTLVELSSSPERVIYDPFLGSGTTMVAAHQLGRVARGIEIEPSYCAVILERMSNLGQTPRRVSG